jgi:hypothetical protein
MHGEREGSTRIWEAAMRGVGRDLPEEWLPIREIHEGEA